MYCVRRILLAFFLTNSIQSVYAMINLPLDVMGEICAALGNVSDCMTLQRVSTHLKQSINDNFIDEKLELKIAKMEASQVTTCFQQALQDKEYGKALLIGKLRKADLNTKDVLEELITVSETFCPQKLMHGIKILMLVDPACLQQEMEFEVWKTHPMLSFSHQSVGKHVVTCTWLTKFMNNIYNYCHIDISAQTTKKAAEKIANELFDLLEASNIPIEHKKLLCLSIRIDNIEMIKKILQKNILSWAEDSVYMDMIAEYIKECKQSSEKDIQDILNFFIGRGEPSKVIVEFFRLAAKNQNIGIMVQLLKNDYAKQDIDRLVSAFCTTTSGRKPLNVLISVFGTCLDILKQQNKQLSSIDMYRVCTEMMVWYLYEGRTKKVDKTLLMQWCNVLIDYLNFHPDCADCLLLQRLLWCDIHNQFPIFYIEKEMRKALTAVAEGPLYTNPALDYAIVIQLLNPDKKDGGYNYYDRIPLVWGAATLDRVVRSVLLNDQIFNYLTDVRNSDLLHVIIEKYPKILDCKDIEGKNILHYAIKHGKIDFYQRISTQLPHLANQQDNTGQTVAQYIAGLQQLLPQQTQNLNGQQQLVQPLPTAVQSNNQNQLGSQVQPTVPTQPVNSNSSSGQTGNQMPTFRFPYFVAGSLAVVICCAVYKYWWSRDEDDAATDDNEIVKDDSLHVDNMHQQSSVV